MKALSPEAVKRLALAHGAKLEMDGQHVNTARLAVATKQPAPKPQSAPAYMPQEPKPAPVQTMAPTPDPALREVAQSLESFAAGQFILNESTLQLMQSIQRQLNEVSSKAPADKRPAQWVFKVKRDAQGLMETITAKAIYE